MLLFNKNYCHALALGLLSFTQICLSWAAEPPLARVESSYSEDQSGAYRPIHGTGFLVEAPGWFHSTYYLVTASHVSQGENTKVFLDEGKEAKILGRLADNDNDLELMEVGVPAGTKAAFQYDPRGGKFLLLREFSENLKKNGKNHLAPGMNELVITPPWAREKKVDWTEKDIWSELARGHTVALGKEGETLPYNMQAGETQADIFNTGYISRVQILPGMSGAPLVRPSMLKDKEGVFIGDELMGVSSKYSRDFMRSYFTSSHLLSQLLQKYESGTRGTSSCTKWKIRKNLTYKDFCHGTLEINPGFPNAGDGTKADGGDGIKADGGDAAVSGNAWSAYDIRPGMIYNGEPALGFVLTNKLFATSSSVGALYLPASQDSLKLMDLAKDQYHLSKVLKEDNSLLDVLAGKLFPFQHLPPKAFSLGRETNIFGGPDNCIKANIKRIPGSLHMTLELCGKDSVEMELQENGAVKGNKIYLPVVQVRGSKTGNAYSIDLTGLFFENLSSAVVHPLAAMFNAFSGGNAVPRFNFSPSRNPSILIRDLKNNIESFVELGHGKELEAAEAAVALNSALPAILQAPQAPCGN